MSFSQYDLFSISKARNVLFGLAIVCIMFFHLSLKIPPSLYIFSRIKEIGEIGVDIFLFLSGIGLYFSFVADENILSFYKKRFKRILTAYIPVALFWFAATDIYVKHDIKAFIKDFSLISFWTDGERISWFIALILLLYIFYPLIHKLFKHNGTKRFIYLLTGVILISLWVIYNTIYFENPVRTYWIELLIPRIPIFLFGCWIGPKVRNHEMLNINVVYFSAIASIIFFILLVTQVSFLSHLVFRHYLYCPLVICACIAISFLYNQTKKGVITKTLLWLGVYTLEIYLLHEKIIMVFKWLLPEFDPYNISINAISIIATLPSVVIYKRSYEFIFSAIATYFTKIIMKCSSR